jgi:hypothetical protein
MNLVDFDVIGSKPAQGIFDFAHDPIAAGVAKDVAVSPFKPGLRGDQHARAQADFGNCSADDLFGAAETIYRRRIDDIDAVLKRGADRGHRLGFVGSTPQVPIAMRETLSDVPGISASSTLLSRVCA